MHESMIVYSTFLVIVSLGFSTYFALRTSDLRSWRQADVNVLSNVFLADASSGELAIAYQKAAKEWFKLSNLFLNSANLRCYSAVSCLWSLLLLVPAFFLLLLLELPIWLIPFGLAVMFFIFALIIHIYSSRVSLFLRILDKIHKLPFLRQMSRSEYVENIIKIHDFLLELKL